MLHTCSYICHEKCILPLIMMKTLIFILLEFPQTPNSNLHLKTTCLLTCLSLRPKVCVCFVFVFVICLFAWFLVFLLLEEVASSFPRTWARFTSLHLSPFHASASFHSTSIIRCHSTLHLILHVQLHVISPSICTYMWSHPSLSLTYIFIFWIHPWSLYIKVEIFKPFVYIGSLYSSISYASHSYLVVHFSHHTSLENF